jgi:hypothetical protein
MKKLLELQVDLLYLYQSDMLTRDLEGPIPDYKLILDGRIEMLAIILEKINKLKKDI